MDRNSHIIQQQLENLREKGKYAPVWISDVDKRMNPISSMNYLQTQKSIRHQYVKQKRDQMLPKVSSIKENTVTTILQPIYQKPVQVKTVKDIV